MINNIRFKIIAGKINKILEFYTIFAPKYARLHNKTTRSRPGLGQMFEAEAEAKATGRGRSQIFKVDSEVDAKILAAKILASRT